MKKFILISALLTASAAWAANKVGVLNLNFVAPIVQDRTTLPTDTQFGTIIYENASGAFYGLGLNAGTATWKQLGPANVQSEILLTATTGNASSSFCRVWPTPVINQGSDLTYSPDATYGDEIIVNASGVYCISYVDDFNGTPVADDIGVTTGTNSTVCATSVRAVTPPTLIIGGNTPVRNLTGSLSTCLQLSAGTRLHAQTDDPSVGGNNLFSSFRVTKMSN